MAPVAAPPLAAVDPDTAGPWWRRLWPLLRARRVAFFGSLLAALLATVAGVLLPRVTMQAIDLALVDRTEPLSKYLWLLGGLGAFRAVLTYGYRSRLYRVAYDLEYDLRTIVYGHLTRLSFEFFDRVQSGQLISRANSDIRSVQMFLTFAPMIAITFAGFFVALALMLTISRAAHDRGAPAAAVRVRGRPRGCATRSSRSRGSCRPAWPRWPRWSTRT